MYARSNIENPNDAQPEVRASSRTIIAFLVYWNYIYISWLLTEVLCICWHGLLPSSGKIDENWSFRILALVWLSECVIPVWLCLSGATPEFSHLLLLMNLQSFFGLLFSSGQIILLICSSYADDLQVSFAIFVSSRIFRVLGLFWLSWSIVFFCSEIAFIFDVTHGWLNRLVVNLDGTYLCSSWISDVF